VRDSSGAPVESSEDFDGFRHEVGPGETDDPNLTSYREALLDAVKAVRAAGVNKKDIVAASVFTTQSVTAVLEKTRNQIKAATPAPADFLLGPDGARTVFSLDNINGIAFDEQTGDAPSRFTTIQVPISQMKIVPGAVGRVAFGKFLSPNYLTPESYIPPVATRNGTPVVQSVNEIFFNLYLPSGTAPPGGWPVAIFGHGRNGDKNFSMRVAAKMAQHGLATIAINAVGHGFGPLGTLTVSPTVGGSVTFSAGGRANDQNADHTIGATEGWTAAPSKQIIGERDGNRQTIIDLMQLVRVIEVGMDADGEGIRDIDPSRIYYFGWSMGGIQGAAFAAIEPSVRAAVLNSPGAGGDLELGRLSPLPVGRQTVGALLQSRVPSLLNSPGVTSLGGVGVAPPFFNENIPLRGQLSVINTVVGAMEIQEVIENTEWVRQSVNPAAYAPHLRRDPLAGVPAKPLIIQFARGDRNITNPKATEILRAGDLADRATLFRTDLAFALNPTLLVNYPHRFMSSIDAPVQVAVDVALGAQEQIASFFASDGQLIIRPEPAQFFEVPIALPLPEDFFFLP
jgi:pimeloyl-ACP methyl ester carboxylesterase